MALTVEAAGETYVRSVTLGVVWALRAHGYKPAVNLRAARYLGPRYRYAGRPIPQANVNLRERVIVIGINHASPLPTEDIT